MWLCSNKTKTRSGPDLAPKLQLADFHYRQDGHSAQVMSVQLGQLLPRCTWNVTTWSGPDHLNLMAKDSHLWVKINAPWSSFKAKTLPTYILKGLKIPCSKNQNYFSIKMLKFPPSLILNGILLYLLRFSLSHQCLSDDFEIYVF